MLSLAAKAKIHSWKSRKFRNNSHFPIDFSTYVYISGGPKMEQSWTAVKFYIKIWVIFLKDGLYFGEKLREVKGQHFLKGHVC